MVLSKGKVFSLAAYLLIFTAAICQAAENTSPAFTVDYPGYMSKHDIVYQTPGYESYEGFPLGNGDLGAMIWNTPSGIAVQINKSDAWDQPGEPEDVMLLRSCGRLTVEETAPCYDWLYLNDFEARLSLYEAKMSLACRTPFKTISAESFIPAGRNVFVLNYRAKGQGPVSDGSVVRIGLERWGSRSMRNWYAGIFRGAEIGLGQAGVSVRKHDLCLEETFKGLRFAMACRVVGIKAKPMIDHSHRAEFVIKAKPVQEFTIYCAVATSNDAADPLDAAIKLLDSTVAQGFETVHNEHKKWWADFWKQSFVHIGDDYIENLYYLQNYLMGSSSRGRYPVLFNAGLWTCNRDIRQWVNPHHWNMQQAYWGLCAANHCELMKPYLDTYDRLAPKAEEYAQKRGFKNAILWQEQHDYTGRILTNGPSMVNDFTPASQIGQYFWNYYLYTGDEDFLKNKAYPFMKKAAEFYLQYLTWDEAKGQYDIFPASPYECEMGNQYRNTITDLSTINASFRNCIRASEILNVDADKRAQWHKVIDHLAPYPMTNDPKLGEVFVPALNKDGTPADLGGAGYCFGMNTAPVFPAGVLGLDQKGTREFDTAVRVTKSHPANSLAITPVSITQARLGLADDALGRLSMSIRQLQHFPQGMWYNIDHWNSYSKAQKSFLETQRDYINDHSMKYENIRVWNSKNSDERVSTPMQPFVQSGLEPSAILAAAVNEMLLQSYTGDIRVFPATPNDWPAAFTLRAVGGFLVTSEKEAKTAPQYVCITSLLGKECRIVNPWPNENIVIQKDGDSKSVAYTINNQVIAFPTEKGTRYLICKASDSVAKTTMQFTAQRNTKPKQYFEAALGKPRDF